MVRSVLGVFVPISVTDRSVNRYFYESLQIVKYPTDLSTLPKQ
jgi:hypothetical protein